MLNIDYEKYEKMNERQLLNSLLNIKKRNEKLKTDFENKMKYSSELIRFLKTKLNEKINKLDYNFISLEESDSFRNFNKIYSNMSEIEKQELKNEVMNEINRDYNNEL